MGKQAFTPGPWEVREHEFEGLCVHAPTIEARTACEYRIVENINGDSTARPKYGTPHANASLIAAAPELYEALDHVTSILEAAEAAMHDAGWTTGSEQSAIESAHAALAKAVQP